MTEKETYDALRGAIKALENIDSTTVRKAITQSETDKVYREAIEKQIPLLQEKLSSLRKSYMVGAAGTPCGCCNGSGRS